MRLSVREVGHDLYPIRKDEVERPAVFSIRHVTLPLGNGATHLIKINWEASGCGLWGRQPLFVQAPSRFEPFGAHQRPPAHVAE
jgi:hypothetical protein